MTLKLNTEFLFLSLQSANKVMEFALLALALFGILDEKDYFVLKLSILLFPSCQILLSFT